MKFKKNNFLLLLFPICFALNACNEKIPDSPEKEMDNVADVLKKSTAFERDSIRKDATVVQQKTIKNPRNENWYTYDYFSEDGYSYETIPAKIKESEIKKVTSSQEKEVVNLEIPMAVYTVSETDRPPLFNTSCLKASNPELCSNEAIEEFVKSNINFPNKALTKDHDGLEIVSFVINKSGEIEDKIEVLSKDKPCSGCAKAAVEVVANMENWSPALVNGKPVKVRVSLPIRFEIENQISLK